MENSLIGLKHYCYFLLDDFGGHGNSFHGTGGRGSKRAQMRQCIRLLRSLCSTSDQQIYQDLADQGAIAQIVGKWHIIAKVKKNNYYRNTYGSFFLKIKFTQVCLGLVYTCVFGVFLGLLNQKLSSEIFSDNLS